MTLLDHAKFELKLLGESDEMEQDVNNSILTMIRVFAQEGHSGVSAMWTIDVLTRLLKFQPLTSLTGADDEWINVSKAAERPLYQNKRCSHVFKDDDGPYDIEGKKFREPDGCIFTSSASRVPIEFPYTPKTEIVDVPKEES